MFDTPLKRFSLETPPDLMTTLGVPLKDLDVHFGIEQNHHHPIPLGENAHGVLAYPVFETWTHHSLFWTQAADLARTLAQHIGVVESRLNTVPETHLLQRLLRACCPAGDLENENSRQMSQDDHARRVLKSGSDALRTDNLFLSREEAAELAQIVHTQTNIPKNTLQDLLQAAAPPLLFARSAHEQIQIQTLHRNILSQGANALPSRLRPPR